MPRTAKGQAANGKKRKSRPLPDFDTAPVFTFGETAVIIRGSLSTVRRRVADGTLKTVSLGEHSRRVTGDSLRRYVREGRT
jgi:hypothetical protein